MMKRAGIGHAPPAGVHVSTCACGRRSVARRRVHARDDAPSCPRPLHPLDGPRLRSPRRP